MFNLPHLAIAALVVVLGWPVLPGTGLAGDVRSGVLPGGGVVRGAVWDGSAYDVSGRGAALRHGDLSYEEGRPGGLPDLQPVTWWFSGGNPSPEEIRVDEANGFLHLSEKEFREFDSLIRSTGFALQGLRVGLGGLAEMELSFDFERLMSDQEKTSLRQALERQYGTLNALRKAVILALMDAGRYGEAGPAQGFRLRSVSLRLGNPADFQLRFRRNKP